MCGRSVLSGIPIRIGRFPNSSRRELTQVLAGCGVISETAKAKLNLTLQVLGRRTDGYHELISLVAFADAGDTLSLVTEAPFGLETNGPFATDIDGENLVAKACRLVQEADPCVRIGHIRLTKNLPVAAGLGGGSADAAALLRAVLRAAPGLASRLDIQTIVRRLGADVTVCLQQRPALMSGAGETVTPMSQLPDFWLVLANPGVPLSTAEVLRALGARAFDGAAMAPRLPGPFATLAALVKHLRANGNDLQETAIRLCPAIGKVLGALAAEQGCHHAAQSGSGPTCFGIYAHEAEARQAARAIRAAHPNWWVTPARGDGGQSEL